MAKEFSLASARLQTGHVREALYNALDCIATLEVSHALDKRMTDADRRTHDFYMGVQVPAFDMGLRGIRVDPIEHDKLRKSIRLAEQRTARELANHPQIKPIWDKLVINSGACAKPSRKDGKHKWPRGVEDSPEKRCEDCGASRMIVRPFLPSSTDDVKHLWYDLWKMRKQHDKDGKVTTSKEARERLAAKYAQYEEPLKLMADYADLAKQAGFLEFRKDDSRFRSNFNVGVTNTHRWSSNQDNYGRGGNAQNITEKHRHIFVADPGYELCYADLKQAESNVIANVSGDPEYIAAHRSDTHTYVCRLVWPEGVGGEKWTGDLAQDKKIATSHRPAWDDRPGHDFRYQSKAVQHGSNLGLTPFGMAIQKRIPVAKAQEGQQRYFKAFPGIKVNYQEKIRYKVQNTEPIVTPFRVRFKLFGRPLDEHTYKEGLSIIPQSVVGHIISIGCYRIFRDEPDIQLLAQVHDAILFQFPKGQYQYVYRALELMTVPLEITGFDGGTRTIEIGTEAAVGLNWGHHSESNPEGVREITFTDENTWRIK